MTCVNCKKHLFFFNETDELWSETDQSLCYHCRRKVDAFMEEPFTGTNLSHLRANRDRLRGEGLTDDGLEYVEEYCRYLDRLYARTEQKKNKATLLAAIQQKPDPAEGGDGHADDGERLSLERMAAYSDEVVELLERLSDELDETGRSIEEKEMILFRKVDALRERMRLLTILAASGVGTGALSFLTLVFYLLLQ